MLKGLNLVPFGAVCDIFYKWENEGVLSYETCEAREGCGFDGE